MGCCCAGGCPGSLCSECSGTPDKSLYLTTSGIVPETSGVCHDPGVSPGPMELDYPGTYQDAIFCLTQDSAVIAPCSYFATSALADIFTPLGGGKNSDAFHTTCASLSSVSAGTNRTCQVSLSLASGVYSLAITLRLIDKFALLFYAQASVASPPCRIKTPIVFTNSITVGNAYTVNTDGGGGPTATATVALASGGSAALVFKQSCCP